VDIMLNTADISAAAILLPVEGAQLSELRQIPAEGGPVLHMLRLDSPQFSQFGEIYFSEVLPRRVKAWKRHSLMTQLFAVPVGCIHVVLYDGREKSPTSGRLAQVTLGRPDNYRLLRIPPQVWYGFAATGDTPALVANCTDIPHRQGESERAPQDAPFIPFSWAGADLSGTPVM
jgi:dTDP-4-dehydrorhamnose 3,5-epimerase